MSSTYKSAFFFLALVLVITLTFDSILIPVSASPLHKRQTNTESQKGGLWYGTFTGQATYYSIGLGACGKQNTDQQLVAALPHSMFDPSPNGNPNLNQNCGRTATLFYGGKSVTVTIKDECMGCEFGDMDLSRKCLMNLMISFWKNSR
ncbi:17543_t:CDS:1 [Acaulospora colombiana]|uniref:17543_t:CDS:1 n=1 Tax=Acaulospora colombiana TaxID=27376 RepID=A0ACA9K0C4_9GLOM|nr:17543_t:CDS:1 [Acaulospora colombiana]